MKDVDHRLQRLVASDICQAQNAEDYREALIRLAHDVADVETAKRCSKFFKALSDEKRLRILKLLRLRELCICELMIALDMSQPNLSHHIRILENEGLVNRVKRGKWVYCALANRDVVNDMIKMNVL
jgi:predicted transcriptional regulator